MCKSFFLFQEIRFLLEVVEFWSETFEGKKNYHNSEFEYWN